MIPENLSANRKSCRNPAADVVAVCVISTVTDTEANFSPTPQTTVRRGIQYSSLRN